MLCVLIKVFSHVIAKKETKRLKGFGFDTFTSRFQMTSWQWRGEIKLEADIPESQFATEPLSPAVVSHVQVANRLQYRYLDKFIFRLYFPVTCFVSLPFQSHCLFSERETRFFYQQPIGLEFLTSLALCKWRQKLQTDWTPHDNSLVNSKELKFTAIGADISDLVISNPMTPFNSKFSCPSRCRLCYLWCILAHESNLTE